MTETFPLRPMSRAPYITVGLMVAIFACTAAAVWLGSVPMGVKLTAGVVLVVVSVPPVLLIFAQRTARMVVEDDQVRIHVPLYGRVVPLAEIEGDTLRILSFGEAREMRPLLRTNGIGLPGLAIGWHRLRIGARAYLATTTTDRLLCWRMRDDVWVMVGLADCDAGMRAIEARIGKARNAG